MPVITPEKTFHNLKTVLNRGEKILPSKFSSLSGNDSSKKYFKKKSGSFGVISFSTAIENEHFSTDYYTPSDIAYCIMLRAIMHTAVTSAIPQKAFISLGLPDKFREDYLMEIFSGLHIVSSESQTEIIAGDIAKSDSIILNGAVYGETDSEDLLKKNKLKPGASIYITGKPGNAEAGFRLLSSGKGKFSFNENILIKKFRRPLNRSNLIPEIFETYKPITSVLTTEGILPSLNKIVNECKCGYSLDINKIPLHDELIDYCKNNSEQTKDILLHGRFENELLFISDVPPPESETFLHNRIQITRIGEIIPEKIRKINEDLIL